MLLKDAASQYFFSTLRSLGQVLLAVGVVAFLFALLGGESASGVRRAIANISQGLLFGGHQTTDAGYARRPIERYTPRAAPQRQPAPAPQAAYPSGAPYGGGAQTGYAPAPAPYPAQRPQPQPTVYTTARRAPPPCVSPVAIHCDAPLSRPPMRRAAAPQPAQLQPQRPPQVRPQMQPQPQIRPQMRPYATPAAAPPRLRRPAPVITDPAQWRRAFEAGIAAQGFYLPREAQWADYVADYWRVMIERWPYRLESPYFCVDQQGRRVLMSHEHGKPPGCGLSQREPGRTLNLDALPRAAASARPARSADARPQAGAETSPDGAAPQ